MEPLSVLTASAIAQLAFDEFIKAGSGELAKKTFSGAASLTKNLRGHIFEKFNGNPRAQTALKEVTNDGSSESLEKVIRYLDIEMLEDKTFTATIQEIARQITVHQNTTFLAQTNNNFGRDQNIINQAQGEIRIGGS
jgi:hypothetical protein